ncbi:uncharacterized protein LOC144438068 [Glandiceps talaboti]
MAEYNMKEVYAIRVLVHNGLAFYATWCTIATLLNLAMTLAYFIGIPQHTASTVALSILSVEIVAWFIVENFVFEQFLRYTVSPYLVIFIALSGSLTKNWDPKKTNSIFTIALLGVAVLLSVIRVGLLIWRQINRPLLAEKPKIDQKV